MGIRKKLLFFTFIVLIFLLALLFIKTNKKAMPQISSLPKQKSTRQAAVAGSFYPADAEILKTKLENFLSQAKPITASGQLRILIVPHAGIDYSGGVAAWGFKQVEGKNYTKIILLGASHQAYFDYAAVDSSGSWETPQGQVDIDEDLARAIVDEDKKIIRDSNPHQEEHSLEIELIFLQKVLARFKIVPILVSQPSDETADYLAKQISQNFDDQTLLVVSSDLSHYPSWETANRVDKQTIEAITSGKKDDLERTVKDIESKNYPNLVTAACGYQAIRIALKVADDLQLKNLQKIRYENSGDLSARAGVAGDKSRVVGYAAVGIWGKEMSSIIPQLDNQAQKEAIKIARNTLNEYINNQKIIPVASKNKNLSQHLGAFVTLRENGQLRGCIGEFEPDKPLSNVIQDMTIAAATKDMRFLPVQPSELPQIKIEISVLTPKRKITNWKEIQLEKHGVVIQKGDRAGTFLPQVAIDTGWSLEEFLSQLCSQKAGLPSDCYKNPNTTIYTFEAQVFEEEREK